MGNKDVVTIKENSDTGEHLVSGKGFPIHPATPYLEAADRAKGPIGLPSSSCCISFPRPNWLCDFGKV